jgi:hypothetical protein
MRIPSNILARERTIAATGLVASALAAALAYPRDGHYLLGGMWLWGGELIVLALPWLLRARPAATGGAAFAMALHLACFNVWRLSTAPRDSMAWLFYYLALPGAVLACVGLGMVYRSDAGGAPGRVARRSAAIVAASLAFTTLLVIWWLYRPR